MSKNSSAKYIMRMKKDYQKYLMKFIIVFLNKEKKKGFNIVAKGTKIQQKIKSKSWLDIEKNVVE